MSCCGLEGKMFEVFGTRDCSYLANQRSGLRQEEKRHEQQQGGQEQRHKEKQGEKKRAVWYVEENQSELPLLAKSLLGVIHPSPRPSDLLPSP